MTKVNPSELVPRLVRLARTSQEPEPPDTGSAVETWDTETLALMCQLEQEPDARRAWQLCLALERQQALAALVPSPVTEEHPDEQKSLYPWASQLVTEKRAAHSAHPAHPAHSWWDILQLRVRTQWEHFGQALHEGLVFLQSGDLQIRARGYQPPMAVFAEVSMELHKERCSFAVEQNKVYAFKTLLPEMGYIAVLQIEEQGDEVLHQLIYPQHATHLSPMGPGTIHLFSTEFEARGQTQFLLLFSKTSFEEIASELWSDDFVTWDWDEALRERFASYLLDHQEQLTPFILEVNVTGEQP